MAALKNPNAHLTIQVTDEEYVVISAIGDWWKRETKFTLGKPFYENLSDRHEKVIVCTFNLMTTIDSNPWFFISDNST